jgi:hypothetical protein
MHESLRQVAVADSKRLSNIASCQFQSCRDQRITYVCGATLDGLRAEQTAPILNRGRSIGQELAATPLLELIFESCDCSARTCEGCGIGY